MSTHADTETSPVVTGDEPPPEPRHGSFYTAVSGVTERLDFASGWVARVGMWLSILTLLLATGYVALSVLAQATGWFLIQGAEEFGGFALVLVFFFGLAHGFRSGSFVRVAPLDQRLPRLAPGLLFFRYLVAAATSIVIEYYCVTYFQVLIQTHQITLDVPQIPVFWPYISILVGNAALCLELIVELLKVGLGTWTEPEGSHAGI